MLDLGPDNRELTCDLDGDGADEIYIRSPNWVGVLKLEGNQLRLLSIQHDWVGDWNLGASDREYVGRFSQADRDEVLIRSGNWLGLLCWDPGANRLQLKSIQSDWIDQWNLGPDNWHHVGDFDGDGLSEIYIRSPHWAGMLKWNGARFELLWIVRDTIPHFNGRSDRTLALLPDNVRSYVGRFLDDRDGVIHRWSGGVGELQWLDGAMKVRHYYTSSLNGMWSLGANDRFVVGRFIKGGPDPGDPTKTIITPDLSAIFIHNAWGTGNVGVHYARRQDGTVRDQISLTWIQKSVLMSAH